MYIGSAFWAGLKHRPLTVLRKVILWSVLRVYITAAIFLSSFCCFFSLPALDIRLSAQRSIYCCFPSTSESDLSLPFIWTWLFCLEQRQLRIAFLVIYSKVLTFQFIKFFPVLSVCLVSPGVCRGAGQKVPPRAEGDCQKCICHLGTTSGVSEFSGLVCLPLWKRRYEIKDRFTSVSIFSPR